MQEDHFSLTGVTGLKAHRDMVKQTPEGVLQPLSADTLSELYVLLFALW